ncbi:putative leucine-rich repeat receptor-like protein [Dirofilaria immitis]
MIYVWFSFFYEPRKSEGKFFQNLKYTLGNGCHMSELDVRGNSNHLLQWELTVSNENDSTVQEEISDLIDLTEYNGIHSNEKRRKTPNQTPNMPVL